MTINGLKCKVLAKSGKYAEIEVVGLEGVKQKLEIASDYLPTSCEAGTILKIYLFDENAGQITEKKLAKEILNEILNGK